LAGISLNGVVTDSLIRRFQGVASGSTSGNSLANALTGKGSSSATISDGLRLGARTFATGVQALNTAITFLNTGKVTLDALGSITDKMITLAEGSAKSSSGSDTRHNNDVEFQRLANLFQRNIKNSKIGEREYLTLEGISEYLQIVGLDKEKSESVAAIFKKFVVPEEDDTLASEDIQGQRPVPIPPGAFAATSKVTVEYSKLFDEQVNIQTRPNAYKVLNDLKALKEQIDDNQKALDSGIKIIQDNVELVRAAGLAFLDLSEQITTETDAEKVAEQLRLQIQKNAPAALAQAENLEAIVVAALTLEPDKLGFVTDKGNSNN
jgi:hypothetical protein